MPLRAGPNVQRPTLTAGQASQVPEPLLTQATPQANWAAAGQIRTWLGHGRVSWRGERGVVTSLPPASNSSCINGYRLRSSSTGVDGVGKLPTKRPPASLRLRSRSRWGCRLTFGGHRDSWFSIPSKAFATDDIPVAACPLPTRPAPSRHQHRQPTSLKRRIYIDVNSIREQRLEDFSRNWPAPLPELSFQIESAVSGKANRSMSPFPPSESKLVGSSLTVISREAGPGSWMGKCSNPRANRGPETRMWVSLRATKTGRAILRSCRSGSRSGSSPACGLGIEFYIAELSSKPQPAALRFASPSPQQSSCNSAASCPDQRSRFRSFALHGADLYRRA